MAAHGQCGEIEATYVVRLLLFAFVVACVFDPADQVFGVKVWLFVAIWVAALNRRIFGPRQNLPASWDCCSAFCFSSTVPLVSIVWYYLTNGTEPYAGFALMKGFLLVSVAIVLVINRVDVLPFFSATLTVLALMTIAIFVSLQVAPERFPILKNIGSETGLVLLSERSYGGGSVLHLCQCRNVAVAGDLNCLLLRSRDERGRGTRSKLIYASLTAISIVGHAVGRLAQ